MLVLQDQAKDDDPLNEAEDSAWNTYFRDVEEFDQIQRDVERTHQGMDFFACSSPAAEKHRQVCGCTGSRKVMPAFHHAEGFGGQLGHHDSGTTPVFEATGKR